MSLILLSIAVLHILAALKHHFWNKGRRAAAHAALHQIREGQIGEMIMMRRLVPCLAALSLSAAASAAAP